MPPMRQDNSEQTAKAAVSPPGESPTRLPSPPAASVWGRGRLFFLSAALLAAAAAALAVDCPLAQWCLADNCPPPLRTLLQRCEPFGHGLGVLVIALAIHQLDRARRWALPRVLTCSWGAGLAANGIKLLVHRWRPGAFDRHLDFQGDVWTTFGGWLPGTGARYDGQSFPSAHTATAVGLAIALTWLYPNGRMLFFALVVLAAGQRIESGAHYLSDVLCGAALGVVVATACLKSGRLSKWFDRLEDRWRASSKPPRASL